MGRQNTLDDVWRFIDTREGNQDVCWLWTGARSGPNLDRGYLSINKEKKLAHRIVFEMFNGPIADNMVVRHVCNNGLCCNPKHLILGTRSDNEKDKVKTDTIGLPVPAVREIRRLLASNIPQAAIAKFISSKYGVECSRSTVRNIKLGTRRSEDEMSAEEIMNMSAQEIRNKLT